MITVDEFKRLQRIVEAKQKEADRAAGAYSQLTARLKEEFGCATLKAAATKLSRMEEEIERQSAAFDKAYSAFIKEHGETINA